MMREAGPGRPRTQRYGNNLNQIARHLNTTGDLRDWDELREALVDFQQIAGDLKSAVSRVLDL